MQRRRPPSPFEPRFFADYIKTGKVVVLSSENRVFVEGKERGVFFDRRGYAFFRIVLDGKRRAFSLSRVVWMLSERHLLPHGCELDHEDENPSNNDRDNLICVWWSDHLRLHRRRHPFVASEEEIPF